MQLKAELIVIRRDYAIMRTQLTALSSFLLGIAPQGSSFSGSIINLDSIANEELILDSRIDALIQRVDALLNLVQFEVSYFQNRVMFALTAVSAVFLPVGFFVAVVYPIEKIEIGLAGYWVAIAGEFPLPMHSREGFSRTFE